MQVVLNLDGMKIYMSSKTVSKHGEKYEIR